MTIMAFMYRGVSLSREIGQAQTDPAVISKAMERLLPQREQPFGLQDQKRVYFAHPQPLYGTDQEKRYMDSIRRVLGRNMTIVNPADASEFQIRDMGFYLDVVCECDALVYVRLKGSVLGGVGLETEFAINSKKQVYELGETNHANMVRVFRTPEYLSHEETVQLLKDIGFRK